MATPVDVRTSLQGVLILELIGPIGPPGSYEELLTLIPSRWCVPESLVLTDIDDPQGCDRSGRDELDLATKQVRDSCYSYFVN